MLCLPAVLTQNIKGRLQQEAALGAMLIVQVGEAAVD